MSALVSEMSASFIDMSVQKWPPSNLNVRLSRAVWQKVFNVRKSSQTFWDCINLMQFVNLFKRKPWVQFGVSNFIKAIQQKKCSCTLFNYDESLIKCWFRDNQLLMPIFNDVMLIDLIDSLSTNFSWIYVSVLMLLVITKRNPNSFLKNFITLMH